MSACFCLAYYQVSKAHVSAPTERLLRAAENMDLVKMYRDGTMRQFCINDLNNFKNSSKLHVVWCGSKSHGSAVWGFDSLKAFWAVTG